ncbi:MAG TPA: glycosyltransferase family 4 protein [Pyrinomonadaceae bacterium]|jgi:hypothetical protein
MPGLKVLLTNFRLAMRTGTELYVRDVALELLRRGHSPFIYSPHLGELARELSDFTIPVVDDLNQISTQPDIIHGHHHTETITALLHFPSVPAIYVCHDWYSPLDRPPDLSRVRRYVAIDQTCYDKLIYLCAVPEERLRLIHNFVDLERFKPRAPLPPRPRRALVFSNYALESPHLKALREACAEAGSTLDVVGSGVEAASAQPEKLLGQYDLVFAKGRAALEAMAVGAAVVIHSGIRYLGPLVTASEVERLLPLNFGIRTMFPKRLTPEELKHAAAQEIARYDASDAAQVSQRIRSLADRRTTVDELIALYEEVISENNIQPGIAEMEADLRAAAAYIRWLSSHMKKEYDSVNNLTTLRLKRRLVELPVVGKLSHAIARWLASPLAK